MIDPSNPAQLGRRALPRVKASSKQRHRQAQNFTREEVAKLLADPRVPADRRMLYTLAFYTAAYSWVTPTRGQQAL